MRNAALSHYCLTVLSCLAIKLENGVRVTVWISHRGLKDSHAENSLEAFRAAVASGFSWLETDLRCTRDGVIVLSHDPDFLRTAGSERPIAECTWAEIQKLRLKGGESVPAFEAFAVEFERSHWVLDIKPETAGRTIEVLVKWSSQSPERFAHLNSRCRFLLWAKADEARCRQFFPGAEYFPQEAACYRAALAAKLLGGIGGGIESGASSALVALFAGMSCYSKSVAEVYHRKGAKVLAFLPASRDEIKAALSAGFDEILTDRGIEQD